MCFVLAALMVRWFVFDDCSIFSISSWKVSLFAFVGYLGHGEVSVLSSEYFTMELSVLCARRSSVNITKIFEPPTVPCEHPVSI